jgi:hypothetical protein
MKLANKEASLSFLDTISLELSNFNGSYYDFYVSKKKHLTKQQQKILKQWLKLQKPKSSPFLELYHPLTRRLHLLQGGDEL